MAPFPTLSAALLASTALVGIAPALAQGLPTGGHVVSGGVSIGTPQGGSLAITQSSQNAIVNWQGFSIGQGNRVDIHQPNSQAAILNRVTGTTRSTIAGQLNANGQVYLVNPNGIAITRTGQVNAAGFVASTLDIADDDFRAGRRQFHGSGASAKVTNRGAITIARGGYAALIGGSVDNAGTISVPMGKVGLGSGEQATLDLSGDGFLQVAVPTGASGHGALVRHSGTISADGGSVTLTAAAARDMARQAVNLSGTVEARAVSGRNGRITLSGGDGAVEVAAAARLDASGADTESGGRIRIDGRRLDVAGTLDVSGATGGRVRLTGTERLALSGRVLAEGRTGRGGRVTATAPAITTNAALIEASGATGGGTVRLGGARQGQGRLAHAQTVDIDAATTIRADATQAGTGGDVVIWSDATTRFAGTISAKGGPGGGDGGQAEVSSKGVLAYSGTTILTAAHGAFGTLLLDPYDLTISNGGDAGTTRSGGTFTAGANDSVLSVATLQAALTNANVTVSTGSGGSQAGNITVAAPVTWSSGSLLTLSAANAIAVNAPITVSGGGQLALNTATASVGNTTQPLLSFGTGASVTFASGQSGQALTINGTNYSLIRSMSDVAGLNNQSGTYALAGNLDASGTTYGGAVVASFSGTLEGLGHTIANLTISALGANFVGPIGILNGSGTVRDLGLLGGSMTGSAAVGGLVAWNDGGTVTQSYATGAVSGGTNSNILGGLVGYNRGTVTQSYATGAVSGGANSTALGGLVGFNSGTVTQSYATGAVSGGANSTALGGLVGYSLNGGTVTQSYATGAVSGGANSAALGGLVGFNSGTVTQSYWDTQTSGQAYSAGGTGLTTTQFQSGAASGLGAAFAGGANGLYPYLSGFFPSGVQAVSGTVYKDAGATPAGSGAAGAVTVSLDAAGRRLAQTATTGANGYYYVALPAGTLANGTGFVASVPASGSLSTAAATLASATYTAGSPAQAGIDLYGGALTVPTAATTLSGAPSLQAAQASANAVAGSGTQSLIAGLTGRGLVATGTGFTIDQPVTTGGSFLVRTAAGAPLTVAAPVAIADGGSLGLLSGGALRVNAPVQARGAVSVALAYDASDPTNLSFAQGSGLSFLNADGSAATAAVPGQALTINGAATTLVYSMAQLDAIDGFDASTGANTITYGTGLAGRYALAGNLTATGTTYSSALIGRDFPSLFTGAFEGLGHTITGLTITAGSYAGLLGHVGSGGMVRDVGLVGGSVSGGNGVGGLVGVNENGGTITQAYNTGSISGTQIAGGLVGYNSGTIARAYATGAVNGTFGSVGGLVGSNNGTITQVYATGAVSGTNSLGGLVGSNNGTIIQAYATGAVSNTNSVGGLVGQNSGTITQSYWDTQTSGLTTSSGGTGLTTAQFQSGASALGAAFAGGANGLYPYLASFFPSGVQAVSGTVYKDAGVKASGSGAAGAVTVSLDATGSRLAQTATTGANGYYYVALPAGTLATGTGFVASVPANGSLSTAAATLASATYTAGSPAQAGIDLYGGALTVPTSASTLSGAPTLQAAQASTNAVAGSGTQSLIAGLSGRGLIATGAGFTIDQVVSTGGTFVVQTTAPGAPLTVAQPITIASGGSLGLSASGALAINATVIAQGTVPVALAYNRNTTTPGLGDLSFAQGSSLSFVNADGTTATAAVAGQSLTINGNAYTLIRAMSDVVGLNNQSGTYALAGDIDASGTTYAGAVAASFSGTLEGLGHTIANLTINAPGMDAVGLIGTLKSNGTVRDLGLLGGRVTGRDAVGSLVGLNDSGTIAHAYATGIVSGLVDVGGLVGANSGTISQAYATGAVSGATYVGGLAGENYRTISQAYATGAVSSSGSYVGGLVGANNTGTLTQAYATGAVSGSTGVGGLVGHNYNGTIAQVYATGTVSSTVAGSSYVGGLLGYNYHGTITAGYWDTQTSGQSNGIGIDYNNQSGNVTTLTTAQFQSGAASGLGVTFAGGTGGLYPYLSSFFPNGVQAVSGTVYKDAGVTPAASGAAGAVTVSLDAAGMRLAQTTTGANGYYYVLLPAGTLATGTEFLASAPAGSSLTAGAATLATSPTLTGVDLFGGALTGTTASVTLSGANADLAARTAATGSAAAQALVGGLTGRSLTATGASFTVDQAVTTGGTFLVRTAAGAPLTVAAPVTIADSGSLGLLSGGALRVNAPVHARGAVSVALGYDASDPTNLSFAQGTGLTFLNADGSAATAAVAGQALTVNGQGYTLVYSMAQLDAVDGFDAAAGGATTPYGPGLAGRYALAGDFTATGTTYTDALVGTGSSNAARFSGALEGLGHTIAGLTVAKAGDDAGLFGYVGLGGTVRDLGLVGGSVSGDAQVGSLAGWNAGTITQAYATGAVHGGHSVGGLVGFNDGGTIKGAYATGATSGDSYVGGLIGWVGGTVARAYATGAVTGNAYVGGFAGESNGTITQAYATGAVRGGRYAGGLVGEGYGTITQSYWDTQTSGLTTSSGGTGLTTAQFQSGSASGLGSAFAGGTGGLYPYLASFFPNGVQAVSGTVSGVGMPGSVTLLANGQSFATASAGANGYYYAFAPAGMLPAGGSLAAVLSGTGANGAAAVVTAAPAGNTITGLDLRGGWLTVRADAGLGTLSAIQAATDAALGGATGVLATLPNRQISAASSLRLDTGLSVPGTLALTGTGALSQTAGSSLGASGLLLTDWANVALDGGANTVGTLAARVGNLAYRDTAGLTVGTLADAAGAAVTGVTTGGTVRLASGGDLTLAAGAGVTGTDPVLAAAGRFVNQAGAGSVTATGGRWLVYSADPANDTFGNLDSGNTAVWGTAAGGSVAQAGNRYVFATSPLLTVTSTNLTKTYGEDASAALAGAYTITGFDPGITGAYRGDTAATALSGAPVLTSVGAAAGAGVAGSPYAVTAAANSLAATSGYRLAFADSGRLTVTPRTVTLSGTRTYDTTTGVAGGALTAGNLVNGDSVALSGTGTLAGKNVGTWGFADISGLTLSDSNYTLSGARGTVAITPANLTYTADAVRRTYGAANPVLTGIVTGFLGGDTLANATTGALAFATAAGTGSNVGRYAVTGSGLGANNGNYVFAQAAGNATALTVDPAPLTITGTRTYNAATGFATGQLTLAGGVNGETLTLTAGTGITAAADAGSYTGAGLSGLALAVSGSNGLASNYALPATATLTITPAPIVVIARSGTSVYGDTPSNPGLAATGLQGGQDGNVLNGLSNSFGVTARTGVADSPVLLTVAGTLANPNYVVTARQDGTWTVTPRPLVVTPDTLVRAYGEATPALGAASGDNLVNGDTLGSLALRTPATAGSDVGRYDLTGSDAVFASGTAANYAVTYAPRPGGLVVVPRAITVSADAQSRTYGDANPLLTFTTTALGAGQTLVGGLSTDATSTSGVGTYAITQGTLATANANYVIAYRGADLAVTPRAITLTGSRSYDATTDIAGRALTAGNRVNGDRVTLSGVGMLTGRDAGTWGLADLSGLTLSNPNYTLAGATGSVVITPATITVRANDGRSTYGDAARDPGFSATGLQGGQGVDVLTGLTSNFGLDARSAAGTYTLAVAGSLANPKYRIGAIEAGIYTIDRRPIAVTADAQTRLTGQPNPALTYTIGGSGLVNGDTLTGALATDADAASAPGLYPILQGTLAAGANYILTYRGADLGVPAAPVQTVVVSPDASGLASTAERAARQDGWPLVPNLPLLTQIGLPDTIFADPRSDAVVVCAGHQGGCFNIPLTPRSGPRAGAPAILR